MKLEQLKEKYLHSLLVRGYAEGTILNRRIYLEQFLAFLQEEEITRESLFNYQVFLFQLPSKKPAMPEAEKPGKPLSLLTVIDKLSALSCFLRYLFDHNYLLVDLSKTIAFPKRGDILPRSILTESEVCDFLSLPDRRTRKGIRDRAILELLYSTGIRRAELVGLDLYDVNLNDQTVKVTGKGKKERVAPFGWIARLWLEKYLREVRRPQKKSVQALFLELLGYSRIKKQTVSNLVRAYCKQGRFAKHITTHSFRHTCATHLLRHGAGIRYVQELLGHASPETTQVYTRVEINDLERVYRKTHPRSVRK